MSRIGKQPINIPEGVEVKLEEGSKIVVQGPKGTIERFLRPEISVKIQSQQVFVSPNENSLKAKAFHGLFRTLIANDIQGVVQGWQKTLEIAGVGYRAKMEGENLVLEVGFSHPVTIKPPTEIEFKVEGNNRIIISGIRKDKVGEIAAKIRAVRPPEPYKGKGIHYLGETIRRKEGKRAGAASA